MCTQCYPNAVLQSSPISACICIQGYYPNPSVNACDKCDSSCSACSGPSGTECTLCRLNSILLGTSPNACGCPAGFYLASSSTGLCNTCDASCVECKGAGPNQCTNCYSQALLQSDHSCKCHDFYYLDISTSSCDQCDQSCVTCVAPGITGCITCFVGASLQDLAPSMCVCSSGFFPNTDVSNCSPCDLSCAECIETDSHMCTRCYPNAVLQAPPISPCICIQGYYPNPSVRACSQCDTSCSACSGPSAYECTFCRLNSIILGTSPNVCGCPAGSYLAKSNMGLCATCDLTCVDCQEAGPYKCTSCQSHALLQSDNSCQCIDSYYTDDVTGLCLQCDSACMSCVNSDSTGCTACFIGASLQDKAPSSCVCNSGSYPDPGANKCSPCDPNCQECSGAASDMCTQCYPHAILQTQPSSTCVCDHNYYASPTATTCASCSMHCFDCSGPSDTDCLSCWFNSVLQGPSPNACGCLTGFYLMDETTGVCEACNATCAKCEGPDQCTGCHPNANLQTDKSCSCADSYYLDIATNTCVRCNPSCFQCNNSGRDQCMECFPNAFLKGLPPAACVCSPALYPNPDASSCAACSNLCASCISQSSCTLCKANTTHVNGSCQCDIGYFDTGTGECGKCSSGCQSCIRTGCTECQSFFYLWNGVCVAICPDGFIATSTACADEPPYPSLTVDTNNTLICTFSQAINNNMLSTDVEISVFDLEFDSFPVTWNVSVLEKFLSFRIELNFTKRFPPDNSTAFLSFPRPADLCDANGTCIGIDTLNVTLNPFPHYHAPISTRLHTIAASTASAITQVAFVSVTACSIITGSPTAFFSLFNQLQAMTYIPLMNWTLPDELTNTFIGLNLNLVSLNPFKNAFQSDPTTSTPPSLAGNYGLDTTLFLANSSLVVMSLGGVIVAFIGVWVLSCMKRIPLVAMYFEGVMSKFEWELPLRFWIQMYLDIGITSLLQWSAFTNLKPTFTLVCNMSIAGVFLLFFFLTPIFLIAFMLNHYKLMLRRSSVDFNKKWGVLFLEFEQRESVGSIVFYSLFIIRRLLYALVLVCLESQPIVQMCVLLVSSGIVRCSQVVSHLAVAHPYASKLDLICALFGEGTTFTVLSISSCFIFVRNAHTGEHLVFICKVIAFTGILSHSVLALVRVILLVKDFLNTFKKTIAQIHAVNEQNRAHFSIVVVGQ